MQKLYNSCATVVGFHGGLFLLGGGLILNTLFMVYVRSEGWLVGGYTGLCISCNGEARWGAIEIGYG